jgi:hypothetical protein
LTESANETVLCRGGTHRDELVETERRLHEFHVILFRVYNAQSWEHPKDGCERTMWRLLTRGHVEYELATPEFCSPRGGGELKEAISKAG